MLEQRYELLNHINDATAKPLTALAFVWLGLLVLELTRGLSRPLEILGYVIWGLFVADFAIEFIIAPHKLTYLRKNALTAVSLLVPAVRVLRVLRVFRSLWVLRVARTARAARSVRLVRVLSSVNRGVRATSAFLGRRGAGYVAAATILVVFTGAAGMSAFESPRALREAGFDPASQPGLGYGEAVWWTAMIMTTMGSQYWPQTAEGRVLCFFLSLYAFAVFGYLTATIASYFVAKESDATRAPAAAGVEGDVVRRILAELAALRREVAGRAEGRAYQPAPGRGTDEEPPAGGSGTPRG